MHLTVTLNLIWITIAAGSWWNDAFCIAALSIGPRLILNQHLQPRKMQLLGPKTQPRRTNIRAGTLYIF